MSVIKSFSVEEGDMFYIDHNSDNFTIIDCNFDERSDDENILDEILRKCRANGITRFISTHPDQDHISGLKYIDDEIGISNFYCVENNATKAEPTIDFDKYVQLRDSSKAFYIEKDCSRKWMNQNSNERGSSGLNILWPDTSNPHYQEVLNQVAQGESPNNTSAIIKYQLQEGVKALWMGDLEKDFMLEIEDEVEWPENIDVLFAPHHGRKSGKIPTSILHKINPKMVIIGEAPTENLDYYDGYNKLTQNSTKDIVLDCGTHIVDVHVRSDSYLSPHFLANGSPRNSYNDFNYIGTLNL